MGFNQEKITPFERLIDSIIDNHDKHGSESQETRNAIKNFKILWFDPEFNVDDPTHNFYGTHTLLYLIDSEILSFAPELAIRENLSINKKYQIHKDSSISYYPLAYALEPLLWLTMPKDHKEKHCKIVESLLNHPDIDTDLISINGDSVEDFAEWTHCEPLKRLIYRHQKARPRKRKISEVLF